MATIDLPDTVVRALGPEASQDLMTWIERRLEHIPAQPAISALVARQKVNLLLMAHPLSPCNAWQALTCK